MSRDLYTLIVSDFHLGFGVHTESGDRNILEDFFYDDLFVEFLQYHSQGEFAKAKVELVLNGDFLNHLHAHQNDLNADYLTEKACWDRTDNIIKGHPKVFQALNLFLKNSNHSIVYTMGNHDVGLAWPKVQGLLREVIGEELKIVLSYYRPGAIHVEHGNYFLPDNAVDLNNLFLTRGEPEPVLKLPWGSFFTMHFINKIRGERPYIGKVYPFSLYLKWALIHDFRFAVKTLFQMFSYFLRINFIRDPRRNFHFRDTLKIAFGYKFPQNLDRFAKRILRKHKELKVVVFGHTHQALYRQFAPGKEYLNSGTWNELISLDVASIGKSLRFTYVEILSRGDQVKPALKEWKGSYREVVEVMF